MVNAVGIVGRKKRKKEKAQTPLYLLAVQDNRATPNMRLKRLVRCRVKQKKERFRTVERAHCVESFIIIIVAVVVSLQDTMRLR